MAAAAAGPTHLLGVACAASSALFNGSFTALFKTRRMVALSVHPATFTLYVCCGIFLSSWLVLPFLPSNPSILRDADAGTVLRFSPLGMAAGFLLVLAMSASFSAIDDIGVALAQGIWGGGSMVVSYIWGTAAFGERTSAFSVLGLALLVSGVSGVALSGEIGRRVDSFRGRGGAYGESMPLTTFRDGAEGPTSPHLKESPSDVAVSATSGGQHYVRGVFSAILVGIFGGSILVPLHYVPPEEQGLVFLPSFGIGTLLLSPVVFGGHSLVAGGCPPLHVREGALLTGLLSGCIWNVGNLLVIIAIPAIGYGVSVPLMQCAIVVSGIWGIYVFKEIEERTTIAVFWTCGAVVLLGGTILAMGR